MNDISKKINTIIGSNHYSSIDREENDFYATDPKAAKLLLKQLKEIYSENPIVCEKVERIQNIFNKTEIDFLNNLEIGQTYFTHNILGIVIEFTIVKKRY